MTKTILFFVKLPINQHFASRYGFDYLRSKKIDVQVLNVIKILSSNDRISGHYIAEDRKIDVPQIVVDDLIHLDRILDRFNCNKVISYITFHHSYKIYNRLKVYQIPYITSNVMGAAIGYLNLRDNKTSKIRKLIEDFSGVTYRYYLKFRNGHSFTKYPPLYHSTMHNRDTELYDNRTTIIFNCSYDYDHYLKNISIDRPEYIPSEKYILLLPNHPWECNNYKLLGLQAKITKSEYSRLINIFLNRLEELSGVNIVIAGYPIASSDEDIYMGRKFMLGCDTEQLVKYSSAVIGHHTGAFNFVALHKKPHALISFRSLHQDIHYNQAMKQQSIALRKEILYVDQLSECEELVKRGITYDDESTKEYIFNHVCPKEIYQSKSWSYWEKIVDEVKELQ